MLPPPQADESMPQRDRALFIAAADLEEETTAVLGYHLVTDPARGRDIRHKNASSHVIYAVARTAKGAAPFVADTAPKDIAKFITPKWLSSQAVFELEAPNTVHGVAPPTIEFTMMDRTHGALHYKFEIVRNYKRKSTRTNFIKTVFTGFVEPTGDDCTHGGNPDDHQKLIEAVFSQTAISAGFAVNSFRRAYGDQFGEALPKFYFDLEAQRPDEQHAGHLYLFKAMRGPKGGALLCSFTSKARPPRTLPPTQRAFPPTPHSPPPRLCPTTLPGIQRTLRGHALPEPPRLPRDVRLWLPQRQTLAGRPLHQQEGQGCTRLRSRLCLNGGHGHPPAISPPIPAAWTPGRHGPRARAVPVPDVGHAVLMVLECVRVAGQRPAGRGDDTWICGGLWGAVRRILPRRAAVHLCLRPLPRLCMRGRVGVHSRPLARRLDISSCGDTDPSPSPARPNASGVVPSMRRTPPPPGAASTARPHLLPRNWTAPHGVDRALRRYRHRLRRRRRTVQAMCDTPHRPYHCHSIWVRDVHEEGIEPHPGPSAISKNIDGLTNRFDEVMYKISQRHKHSPILVLFLQEHHLTRARAQELNVQAKAKQNELLYVQAHRPDNEGKGGTAIVIPFNMIEPQPNESPADARKRVYASAYRSLDGRMVSVTTLINGHPVTMSSIYAPVDASQRPGFFAAIKPRISAPHIIGADANCIADPKLDVSRPGPPQPADTAGFQELHDLTAHADLTDITRETLGDATYYTNVKVLAGGAQTTRKRIDHLYTPNLDATIWKFIPHSTDFLRYQDFGHSMIEAKLTIVKEKRGRDLPFINEAIYDDADFNAIIAETITETMAGTTDGQWGAAWERTKIAVRDLSLERTDHLRKAKDAEVERLKQIIQIAKATAQGNAAPAHATLVAEILDMEKELYQHQVKRRSLHDMLEKEAYSNGQKHDVNTAAFHRQWTPQNSAQWVEDIILRDWTDPSNPRPLARSPANETRHDHIASAFTEYYKPLYADKPPKRSGTAYDGSPIDPFQVAIDTLKQGDRVLPPTADRCGAPITAEEVSHTSAYLPLGKSPGPDRIPNKFYRVFEKLTSPILTKVYNESREKGHFPKTLSEGIISVLYKKKDRTDPRNYRPITLLNNDYKILMRILATRMNEAVVQFVSRDQNGFVPDGFISENIMRLQLIQDMIEDENLEALYVFLDMEKAFDRCSWEFLLEGLAAVGFDQSFIDFIKLVYAPATPGQPDHRPSRRMYVNGFLGPAFKLGSGVAQGCPISPLLFLIVAEPLTRLINNDPNITGITTNNIHEGKPGHVHKISQFADDSTLIMLLADIPHALHIILIWCEATSMKENATKRDILLLGSLRGHPERLPPELTLGSAPAKDGDWIRALGVPMGNDFDQLQWWLERYRVVKMRTVHWNGLARLSITGRNILLQSILYGCMRYWFFTLTVPRTIVDLLESDAKELLWASNPELHGDEEGTANKSNRYIYREASWLPQKQGGGSIMHLPSHITAFQAQWIIKYLDPRDSPWKYTLDHWLTNSTGLGRGVLLARLGHRYVNYIPHRSQYIITCFNSFRELDLQQDLTLTSPLTIGEPLWLSRRMQIPLPTDSIEQWVTELDTYRLSDICGEEGKRITLDELIERVNDCNPNAYMTHSQYRKWRDDRHGDAQVIRMNIPSDVKDILKESGPTPYEDSTPVQLTLVNGFVTYAVVTVRDGQDDQFEELFLDACRYPHRTGNMIDFDDIEKVTLVGVWCSLNKHYQELYAGDEDPQDVPRERNAIIGAYYECFPLNEGWYLRGQDPRNDDDSPRRLSDLTIHEMTVILTKRITQDLRPNCEYNWEYKKDGTLRFGAHLRFKWSDIWGSLGTPLSDPTEEKSWRRLLHRAIDAKNRHRGADHECRLKCGCLDESMLHMVTCRHSKQYWRTCIHFCADVLQEPADMHNTAQVIIFNVGRDNKLLSMPARAFLRHAVRWWYASMTKVYKEKRIFNWRVCFYTTLRKFREAVIRKCVSIRRHYIHRKHTRLTGVVPEEERTKYACVAKLEIDGKYRISPAIEAAIRDATP